MGKLSIGIDTSNYKTSIAVIDDNSNIVYNRSEYLEVKQGERGLRQSTAFFMQSNNLPVFVQDMFSYINPEDVNVIGVSSRPRRVEGSYMPCFLAGCNLATELGAVLRVPVLKFSHQEGHAAAIIETADITSDDRCIFYHLSGGTTEFLLCDKDEYGYSTEIVGGTKDISFGQLLDRLGVQMGYKFPSGMYLDEIAYSNIASNMTVDVPEINIIDGYFNLSGIETKLSRAIERADEHTCQMYISKLFSRIANVLDESAAYLSNKYQVSKVYMAGGVASSRTIRKLITNDNIIFGKPEFSGDNAVGIAILAERYINNKE